MGRWHRMLSISLMATLALGAAQVVLFGPMQGMWNLLFFGRATAPDGFSTEAMAYIVFLYGVLGAVLAGFAVALLAIARGPLRRGERWAWWSMVGALATWFVLDVGFSFWTGFWANALLNMAFGAALFLPLWKLRPFLQ